MKNERINAVTGYYFEVSSTDFELLDLLRRRLIDTTKTDIMISHIRGKLIDMEKWGK